MERLKQDSLTNFQKMTKGDIQAVFRVNSSGVGDDIITHEPSVTALGSIMNTGLSFNSGSSSSLKTGRGRVSLTS